MSSIDALERIINTKLPLDFKYCLVSKNKLPIKIDGSLAKPNTKEDFVDINTLLQCNNLNDYAGVGISIQASNVNEIDIDHCFSIPNDITSIDSRGQDVLEHFKNFAYCEFSFSGTGLRILFRLPLIEDYSLSYYIKNDKNQIEYYQPTKSFRYVTITGNTIFDNDVNCSEDNMEHLLWFLNKYMKKKEVSKTKVKNENKETKSLEELLKQVKILYFKNIDFQDLWFGKAPGSGKDESERDYRIINYLYEYITQDKDMTKLIFETSPYFKTKDNKHIFKWNNQNGRYFEYVFEHVRGRHI